MAAPRDELVSLTYLQWQELYEREKPFQIFSQLPPDAEDQRPTNLVFWNAPAEIIKDMRGMEANFKLDQNGFITRQQEMPKTDLMTEQAVRNEYIPSIEELLRREVDGVDYIYCFDWGKRKNAPLRAGRINVNDKMQLLETGKQVHCDQSPLGAINRLKWHIPDQFEKALEGRLRIINVWRPLYHAVQDNPLALCDGQTIDPEDLVEVDHITRLYHGNTMPDELLIFKIFDSDADVPATCSFHTGFLHSEVPPDVPPRESFEARFLVITYAQQEEGSKDN